jgi:hypothetical protein
MAYCLWLAQRVGGDKPAFHHGQQAISMNMATKRVTPRSENGSGIQWRMRGVVKPLPFSSLSAQLYGFATFPGSRCGISLECVRPGGFR